MFLGFKLLGFKLWNLGGIHDYELGSSLIEGLRVVPVFLYRYSMINYTEKGS